MDRITNGKNRGEVHLLADESGWERAYPVMNQLQYLPTESPRF